MKTIAAAALAAGALLAGCAGPDNPWDTGEDVERYEEQKETILALEIEALQEKPGPAPMDEDLSGLGLDAWKASTTEIGAAGTLQLMRASTEARIAHLQAVIEAAKAAPHRTMDTERIAAEHELAAAQKRLAIIRAQRGR